jgi:anti-sigma factor RsiW
LTCREFADFMADYLSGELAAEATARFDHHLALCPNCRVYLANYREAVRLGRQALADDASELPPDVPPGLVDAILAARRG